MKKLFIVLFILCFFLGACQKKPDLSKPFEIWTYDVDMSGYEGLDSKDHMFKGTTVSELERVMEEKGYGPFVLSATFCPHCQIAMRYLNEVAKDLDVYIYYLDGASKEYPIQGTNDYNILFDLLYTTLNVGEDGKEIQTPELFTIVDGIITKYQIGTTWQGMEYDDKNIEDLKKVYHDMLLPYSSK